MVTWRRMDDKMDEELEEKLRSALTPDELVEVREGLRVLRTFKSLGLAGAWLKNVLIWCGVVAAAWLTFNEWLIKYIRGV